MPQLKIKDPRGDGMDAGGPGAVLNVLFLMCLHLKRKMHIVWDYAGAIADLRSTTSSGHLYLLHYLNIADLELPRSALQPRYRTPSYSRRVANPKQRQPRRPAINMQAHPATSSANHWEYVVDSFPGFTSLE